MKKILVFLLTAVMILTSCACGEPEHTDGEPTKETEATEATEATAFDPEAIYDAIDETVPVNGTYQIHSKVGVQQLALHPDADFTLLRSVDCEGLEVTPAGTKAQPFTGTINGANNIISNFVIKTATADGDEGIFGYFKGTVKDINFNDVTIVAADGVKNIGGIAGVNEGTISRTNLTGSITVDTAADGANCGGIAGTNNGSATNCVIDMPIAYNAAGKANIGGLAGANTGAENTNTQNGGFTIADAAGKTVGLLCGTASGAEIKSCAFIGGSCDLAGTNVRDLVGANSGADLTKNLMRDIPEKLPDNVQALRDRVVQAMYDMGTVEWHTRQDLLHDCTCSLSSCHGVYAAGTAYYGLPYNHKSSTLRRFKSIMDDENYIIDWAYNTGDSFDTFDAYMGTDCSGAVQTAWWTVSNTTDILRTSNMVPTNDHGSGCIPVGDMDLSFPIFSYNNKWTTEYVTINGEELYLESLAKVRKGDCYSYREEAGGHARMAAADAVVVRDQDGRIDPNLSYILCHEQGSGTTDTDNKEYTSWRLNYKYSFSALMAKGCIPVTCEELLTGEMEPPEAKILDGENGFMGMITGTLKANYYLDEVNLIIMDSTGEEIFNKRMFPGVGRTHDGSDGGGGNDMAIRNYNDSYDMGHFAVPLQNVTFTKGETYTYTVTAYLGTGDELQAAEGTFTYGTK